MNVLYLIKTGGFVLGKGTRNNLETSRNVDISNLNPENLGKLKVRKFHASCNEFALFTQSGSVYAEEMPKFGMKINEKKSRNLQIENAWQFALKRVVVIKIFMASFKFNPKATNVGRIHSHVNGAAAPKLPDQNLKRLLLCNC